MLKVREDEFNEEKLPIFQGRAAQKWLACKADSLSCHQSGEREKTEREADGICKMHLLYTIDADEPIQA